MASPYEEGHSPLTPDTADELDLDSPGASPSLEAPQGTGLLARTPVSEASTMSASSSPLSGINAARRPAQPLPSPSATRVTGMLQERMRAFQLSRSGAPPGQNRGPPTPGGTVASPVAGGGVLPGGIPGIPFRQSSNGTPTLPNLRGPPPPKGGLGGKRGFNLKLSEAQKPAPAANGQENEDKPDQAGQTGAAFKKYAEYIDTQKGIISFKGKATLHSSGVDFAGGQSFSISLDEVDTLEELGKGNYGTVFKVRHSRPRVRRPGLGLAGNKAPSNLARQSINGSSIPPSPVVTAAESGKVMAMKEIRLELDDSKFQQIVMELDVLHRCASPFIIDFYGAFFQEGAVYICMEWMDGGSIDKLYGDGVPENILRKIALSTIMGLKSLKEEHNIIHRDVKPTNILVNTRGQVKICDFGVSGNLVSSIAKTNIGCQSYMAPERISSGGIAQAGAGSSGGTYSVQSDIWSLGLTMIECAMGRYPYPPETYNNIFSQLSAIVDGDPPDLPSNGYSDDAHDFVHSCLNKVPKLRPTYAMLTKHPWVAPLLKPPTITEDDEEEEANGDGGPDVAAGLGSAPPTADKEVATWALEQLEKKKQGKMKGQEKPALHTAPLDTVPSA